MSDAASDPHSHLARDFVGYGEQPPHARWPGNARLALNIVVNYEEGSEMSFDDGDGVTESGLIEGGSGGFEGRDLAAESMYEYGSRVGIWRVLRLLQARAMPATVFATALALERNPAVARAIRTAGYDVCSHGRRWVRAQQFTAEQEAEEIRAAYDSITRSIGTPPLGWYCRYAPTLNTRRLLAEHGGFLYDADAYNDELPYWVRVQERDHLVIPYSLANNDGKFSRGSMTTANDFFEFLRDSFDMLYEEGATAPKMMSVGLHLRLIGHPGRAVGLARFLDHVAAHRDVWVCRRADIAAHWKAVHPPRP
ncbi:chitin deacetylase [Herbaspirillum hiltneri N3]|uniref:Chitin deacetylase n=1 Tax=Herbaspirillum hiltneri N3 TaxID=1262470 RepID=A0ABM5UZA4_9BURK|nr:allantoinase PuuE [Herbaspirillum hiltneri]AKZ62529.1 chitin deacetylase [Herbaspirillum hiltneri N3]